MTTLFDATAVTAIQATYQAIDPTGLPWPDTHIGRALARLPPANWTPHIAAEAHRTLTAHRQHLAPAGINIDAIPAPPGSYPGDPVDEDTRRTIHQIRRALTETDPRRITVVGNELRIEFPYDPRTIEQVKKLPGRQFRRPDWYAPLSTARLAVDTFPDFHHGEGVLDAAEHAPEPVPDRRIEVASKRYRVYSPYDRDVNRLMRQLGARFDPSDNAWTLPARPVAAQRLLPLIVDHGFVDQAGIVTPQVTVDRTDLSKALDADFPTPGLRLEPRPYQRAGIAYAVAARRCFIADPMGLGKTPMGIGSLHVAGAWPALIVCPVKIRTNWCRELQRWLPEGTRIAAVVPPSTSKEEQIRLRHAGFSVHVGQPRYGADVYVTGYPLLHTQVRAWATIGLRALVLDESHYCRTLDQIGLCPLCGHPMQRNLTCKGPEGHMFKHDEQRHVYKVLWTRAAKDIAAAIPDDGMVLCLSGTPNKSRSTDYIPQLDILGRLDEFGGRDGFKARWGAGKDLDELNRQLRATCYVRRSKAEVLPDLPPLDRREYVVDLPPAARAEYDRIEADFLEWIAERARKVAEDLGVDPGTAAWEAKMRALAAENLVRITVLRQAAALAKLEMAGEWVEEFQSEPDRKLIVFAHHRAVIDALRERFGCDSIDGSTANVAAVVDRFQTDPETRVLVVGIMAGGVGLTLTAAEDMLFLEQAWTPGDLDQAEARCYGRVNDAHGATATYLLASGTIDDDMWGLLGKKRVQFHLAADGSLDDVPDAAVLNQSVGGDLMVRYARKSLGLD